MPRITKELFKVKSGQVNVRYPEHKVQALNDIYGKSLPRLLRGLLDELLADGLIHKERSAGRTEIQREHLLAVDLRQ